MIFLKIEVKLIGRKFPGLVTGPFYIWEKPERLSMTEGCSSIASKFETGTQELVLSDQ